MSEKVEKTESLQHNYQKVASPALMIVLFMTITIGVTAPAMVAYGACSPPEFVGAGSIKSSNSGSVSPLLPAGLQPDDILICVIASRDNNNSTMPVGWNAIDPGTDGVTIFGGSLKLRSTSYWKRAEVGETAPLVSHAGNYIAAVIVAYRGCISTGNPIEVQGSVSVNGWSTTVRFGSGITTTTDNARIVEIGQLSLTRSLTDYSGSPTPDERVEGGYICWLVVADFVQALAGPTGARQCTASYLTTSNGLLIALKPECGEGGNTPVGDDVTVDVEVPDSDTTISLEFVEVTETGDTTVTVSESNPGDPVNYFRFLGDYYEITTTASFTEGVGFGVIVTLTYDDADVHGQEENLKLFHNDGTGWAQLDPVEIDTVNNTISAWVSGFSWFAIAEPTPVADAGPDQTDVEATSPSGAFVTLDGSLSFDPDGDPITYDWTWSSGTASGVNPIVELPLGTTTIMLTVSDGDLSDTDTVDITVQDTTGPQVQIIVPMPGLAVQDTVTFVAEAIDAVSEVTDVYFYVREPDGGSGTPIGYEDLTAILAITPEWEHKFDTTLLLDGNYLILAKAIDFYNNEGWSVVVPFSIRNWTALEMFPATERNKAGRTMPIKFSLRVDGAVDPEMPFLHNEQLVIIIYDEADPGTTLQTSVYGDTSTDYRISEVEELYITNFKTDKKEAVYVVDIYRLNTDFIIGSFTFETVKKP